MRVALKIAYDGRRFYGHQRQPDARTVEGECLRALGTAGIVPDPGSAFFRSASRTDRGVSAAGNVIAFDTAFRPDAVVGAFNDRARDVWAWAVARVAEDFHPRRAIERWYRYHLFRPVPIAEFQEAVRTFVGTHDFRSFTSDPPGGPLTIDRAGVSRDGRVTVLDLRAQSFRRGLVRRIVAASVACALGEISRTDIEAALAGRKRDFGMAPPEPLVLMDVRYDFPFQVLLKPKVLDEWRALETREELGLHLIRLWQQAAAGDREGR